MEWAENALCACSAHAHFADYITSSFTYIKLKSGILQQYPLLIQTKKEIKMYKMQKTSSFFYRKYYIILLVVYSSKAKKDCRNAEVNITKEKV